jgi:hypothetical protein
MKPAVLAFASATIAAGLLVLVTRGDRAASGAAPPPSPPAQASPRTARISLPSPLRSPDQSRERVGVAVEHPPPPPEAHPRTMAIDDAAIARVEAVRDGIRSAVRPCLGDAPGPAAQVQLRYTVRVSAGRARTVEAALISSTLGDPAAERCAVEAAAGAAWDLPVPDGVFPIVDAIGPN